MPSCELSAAWQEASHHLQGGRVVREPHGYCSAAPRQSTLYGRQITLHFRSTASRWYRLDRLGISAQYQGLPSAPQSLARKYVASMKVSAAGQAETQWSIKYNSHGLFRLLHIFDLSCTEKDEANVTLLWLNKNNGDSNFSLWSGAARYLSRA